MNAAFSSRALAIISSCRLAETTAIGISGALSRIFATSSRPSRPGMLKSISAMSTSAELIALERLVRSGRLDQFPIRTQPAKGARHHHAGKLAVVYD